MPSQSGKSALFKVYNGIVPEYQDHVIELCCGMRVAMESVLDRGAPSKRACALPLIKMSLR